MDDAKLHAPAHLLRQMLHGFAQFLQLLFIQRDGERVGARIGNPRSERQMIVSLATRFQRQLDRGPFLRGPALNRTAPDIVRDGKQPTLKLLFLPKLFYTSVDGNERLLGKVATIFRVKTLAPKEAQYLSVMPLKEPVEVVFYI